MTVTKRGSGYALNGDVHELTEALNLLESYIEHDAQWAHNRRRRPAMMAQAARYRVLRERLTALATEEGAGNTTGSASGTIIVNEDTDKVLPFVQCAAERCEKQIDEPKDRVYCEHCEENYCQEHGDPWAHNCPRLLH